LRSSFEKAIHPLEENKAFLFLPPSLLINLGEIKDLNKSFDNKEILKDINLSIQSGKIIGLLGKNGVGKTTLIKLINDLLTPTSGEILIKGQKIGIETKKVISYLPERTYLNKQMKVSDVISYFEDFYDNFDSDKAKKLLKDLDLDVNQKLAKMSKGMQEKVQLVLVMSRNADLYVLDEPLGGVDPATRDYILDTILSNFNENASVIISTHLISDIEKILDEVIFIDKGEIVLQSDADKLRKKEKASIDEIFRRMFKC
jgi:ABC-2 type transport system ATP-binding protein